MLDGWNAPCCCCQWWPLVRLHVACSVASVTEVPLLNSSSSFSGFWVLPSDAQDLTPGSKLGDHSWWNAEDEDETLASFISAEYLPHGDFSSSASRF